MKKLLFLLLLASPLLADGPKYSYSDPRLNDEMDNIYYGQKYINAVSIRTNQITASTGTIKSFMVVGTATNDNAPTGRIGEKISATASVVDFAASGVFKDLTSISLTPGDWDVSLISVTNRNGSSGTDYRMGIGTVPGNDGTGLVPGDNQDTLSGLAANIAMNEISLSVPSYRISISVATIFYFKLLSTYTVATPKITFGRISAIRTR